MTPEELAEATTRYRALAGMWESSGFHPSADPDDAAFVVACLSDIPTLLAEVERCWEGLRTGASERDRLNAEVERLAESLEHISRLAADDTVPDAYLRGWITGENQ